MKEKIKKMRNNQKRNYSGELKKIKNSKKEKEKKLNELANLSKEYFEEKYCLKKDLTFSEISKKIKEKKIQKYTDKIEQFLYSGKKITKKELSDLTKQLEKILK